MSPRASLALLAMVCLGPVVAPGRATLTNFTNYNLGSTHASWDVFYGSNYLPFFVFAGGTAGNPLLNHVGALHLTANVTSWRPGPPAPRNLQATGPIGSDNAIPGDREQFYTFFATNILWSIAGATPDPWDTFVFQMNIAAGGNSVPSNILFNGSAPTSTSYNATAGHGSWRWDGISLVDGAAFAVTWNSGTHTGFDAFQIQGGVIPEPSSVVLLATGACVLCTSRRCRRP